MPARLQCPHCPTRVPLWAVELERGEAVCEMCRTLFDASEQLGRPALDRAAELPPGMTLVRHEPPTESIGDPYRRAMPERKLGLLELRRRGLLSDGTRKSLLGLLVLSSLILAMNFAAGSLPDENLGSLSWWSLAIPLIPALALACDRLGYTSIGLDAHMQTVARGPISIGRGVRIETHRLAGFRCVQVDSLEQQKGEPAPPTFDVEACLRGGVCVPLVTQLLEPGHALAIASVLEQHLASRLEQPL